MNRFYPTQIFKFKCTVFRINLRKKEFQQFVKWKIVRKFSWYHNMYCMSYNLFDEIRLKCIINFELKK